MGFYLDAIRSGQKTICDVEGAVRAQTVVQQEYISLSLGRKLEWDPEKERFKNDEEANAMLNRPMRKPWKL